MKPSLGGDASVTLVFDDFWVGADAPRPRAAPDETDPFDTFNRLLGRAAFFEGLASFPVDYADLKKDVVAFRFTAFDSMIVTRRAPAGAPIRSRTYQPSPNARLRPPRLSRRSPPYAGA